jgi:hypothetical protein
MSAQLNDHLPSNYEENADGNFSSSAQYRDSHRHLIEPFVYHFLQVLGMYPRSIHRMTGNQSTPKTSSKFPINPWLALLTTCIVILFAFGFVTLFLDSWESRKKEMEQLEFFTLVNFLFSLTDFIQALLTLMFMVYNSEKLVPLVTGIEEFLNQVINGTVTSTK